MHFANVAKANLRTINVISTWFYTNFNNLRSAEAFKSFSKMIRSIEEAREGLVSKRVLYWYKIKQWQV